MTKSREIERTIKCAADYIKSYYEYNHSGGVFLDLYENGYILIQPKTIEHHLDEDIMTLLVDGYSCGEWLLNNWNSKQITFPKRTLNEYRRIINNLQRCSKIAIVCVKNILFDAYDSGYIDKEIFDVWNGNILIGNKSEYVFLIGTEYLNYWLTKHWIHNPVVIKEIITQSNKFTLEGARKLFNKQKGGE